jgi:hypothetical protein
MPIENLCVEYVEILMQRFACRCGAPDAAMEMTGGDSIR